MTDDRDAAVRLRSFDFLAPPVEHRERPYDRREF